MIKYSGAIRANKTVSVEEAEAFLCWAIEQKLIALDPNALMKVADLYLMYRQWSDAPASRIALSRTLKFLGSPTVYRTGNVAYRGGIRKL